MRGAGGGRVRAPRHLQPHRAVLRRRGGGGEAGAFRLLRPRSLHPVRWRGGGAPPVFAGGGAPLNAGGGRRGARPAARFIRICAFAGRHGGAGRRLSGGAVLRQAGARGDGHLFLRLLGGDAGGKRRLFFRGEAGADGRRYGQDRRRGAQKPALGGRFCHGDGALARFFRSGGRGALRPVRRALCPPAAGGLRRLLHFFSAPRFGVGWAESGVCGRKAPPSHRPRRPARHRPARGRTPRRAADRYRRLPRRRGGKQPKKAGGRRARRSFGGRMPARLPRRRGVPPFGGQVGGASGQGSALPPAQM